jgi:AcrR family transcriptional regulator
MRKKPTQRRAQQTLEELLEAAAQLLDRTETGDISTNRVADRAGYSIGTLYRYFKDKRSMFRAIVLSEMARQETRALAMLDAAHDLAPTDIVRHLVREVLRPFAGRPNVRRHLLAQVESDAVVRHEIALTIDRITDHLILVLGQKGEPISPERRFLLLRVVLAPVRIASEKSSELLKSQAFEDELVLLVLTILSQR